MARRIILDIEGMHCNSCTMPIEGELEDKKTEKKEIKAMITKLGYRVK